VHRRRTKIIATLGPATDAPGMLEALLKAGTNVVRLNLSHGEADDHRTRANDVRECAARLGLEVGVLADLQGPKIRIRRFGNGPVMLEPGQHFVLDCDPNAGPGNVERVGVSYFDLYRDVHPGDTLLLDDGLIALLVENIRGTEIHARVSIGGQLSDRKGINRMGGGLSVGALTDKDREDIVLAAELGADFLAVSFPSTAEDMNEARRLARAAGCGAALVAKIERAEAIQNLAEIIEASDVVMIARGDLGVEIGDAELPGLQKKIVREALARNRAGDHRNPDDAKHGGVADSDARRGAGRGQCGHRWHGCGDAVAGNRVRSPSRQGSRGDAPGLRRRRAPVRTHR
jgi:pyruvate kinase